MTEADVTSRKAVRKAFLQFYRQWPTFGEDSDERAYAEWQALSSEERAAAAATLPAFLSYSAMQAGRAVRFAASTYLKEKRWQAVPDDVVTTSGPLIAATFGKAWMAERFMRLAAPCDRLPPLTRFQKLLLAQGRVDADTLKRERMQKMGWSSVNAMHEQAAHSPGKGLRVRAEAGLLGSDFEPVRVNSDLWHAWAKEHETRGWPWMPETGRAEWIYFPPAGHANSLADALGTFFEKLDRLGQSEAAQ